MAEGLERYLMGELECPVCLLIPRESPVGACPVDTLFVKTVRRMYRAAQLAEGSYP